MSSIYEEIIKRLDTLATDIAALTINEGAGAAGGSLSGSGTTNRIAQWTGASSLGDSTLIKTGAGVLTLSAGADYTLTVAGTSSIAGTLSGGGTVATGGFTLTVPATGTAAMGAGTNTVSTTNNATIDNHTHAITSSSNPGAAARLLASTSNGYLTLVRLGFGRSPQTQIDAISDSGVTFNGVTHSSTAATDTNYIFTRGRGTIATPAAVQNGDSLGSFQFKGYYDGTTISGSRGKIIVNAAENWSSTNQGTNLGFQITPTGGSTTLATLFGLYGAGLVAVGSSIPTARFHVYGAADVVQEIVQAHSTQTANLVEWKSSAPAVQALITGVGGAVFNEAGDAAGDVRIEGDTEANMFLSDASADTIYLGGTTNGIQIDKGGELTLIGTATRWDDLRIEPVVRGTGAKNPSFEVWLNGVYLYSFDDAIAAAEKEVWFQVQMPHSWKEGSTVEPHVHWTNKTAGTAGQVIRWGIEYTKAPIGGTFGATTTIYGTTIVGGGDITVANEHLLTDFAGVDMTGDTLSTVIACRLFRNSSNAADTYTGTAGLLYIDWHYEIDSMGSKTELAK